MGRAEPMNRGTPSLKDLQKSPGLRALRDNRLSVAFLASSMSRKGGGLFTSTRELALTLQTHHRVKMTVVAVGDEYADEDIGAWQPIQPVVLASRGPWAFRFAPEMGAVLRGMNVDLVHTQHIWMHPSVVGARWTRRTGRPLVISPRGMLDPWALRHASIKKRLAGLLFENEHLRSASCLHALCESEARAFRSYGLTNPICVVPNGIRIEQRQTEMRAPWCGSVSDGRRVVLYIGRIHEKKGLKNLLGALHLARERAPEQSSEWMTVIAGWDDGGHLVELEGMVDALSLGSDVKFLGSLYGEEKAAALAGADAYVLPSLSEGLPMAVLEAWAHRLPVVMTPQCNLPEGFSMGAAICAGPTVAGLAGGLEQLFSMSEDDRLGMGDRGLQLVGERFEWDIVGAQMHAVYDWLVNGGSMPSCILTD